MLLSPSLKVKEQKNYGEEKVVTPPQHQAVPSHRSQDLVLPLLSAGKKPGSNHSKGWSKATCPQHPGLCSSL